jgi:hypothetical protein
VQDAQEVRAREIRSSGHDAAGRRRHARAQGRRRAVGSLKGGRWLADGRRSAPAAAWPLGTPRGTLGQARRYPPAPPGYDPRTWGQGQWPNGKWYITDPEGRTFTAHPEDDGHWRHWDIRDPDNKDGGAWPPNSDKPWPTQKRKPNPSQCATDPSGDGPEWAPYVARTHGCDGWDGDPCWRSFPYTNIPPLLLPLPGGGRVPAPGMAPRVFPEPVPVF